MNPKARAAKTPGRERLLGKINRARAEESLELTKRGGRKSKVSRSPNLRSEGACPYAACTPRHNSALSAPRMVILLFAFSPQIYCRIVLDLRRTATSEFAFVFKPENSPS
jgi:hypothetical protein